MQRWLSAAAMAAMCAAAASGIARAEPPWIAAAVQAGTGTVEDSSASLSQSSGAVSQSGAAAVDRAVLAARARLVASLAPGPDGDAAAAAPEPGAMALSLPDAFIAAHAGVAVQVAALTAPAAAVAAPALPGEAEAAQRPVLVTLPLPPEKPWPGVGQPATLLPYTGGYVRQLPALPRLEARGSLASFADDRPYAHFDRQLDCITDHQRFDKADRRQKFPHVCAPTRDLDTGLPAFTTR